MLLENEKTNSQEQVLSAFLPLMLCFYLYNEENRNVEKRIQDIIDNIAGNHWWKDTHGRYLGCSAVIAKTLGFSSPYEVIGKTDYELPWANTADYLVQHDNEVMRLGKTLRREEIIATREGIPMTFMVVKTPLKDDDGNIIGTIGTSVDITEMKKMEMALRQARLKAEEGSAAKSLFLATVSHELRTPLNAIIGLSQMLLRRCQKAEDKVMLSDIFSSGKTLLHFVNEILDFSKLEQRKLSLNLSATSLHELLQGVYRQFILPAQKKGIILTLKLHPRLPNNIYADPMRVRQILWNLIDNAIKFTKHGEVVVTVYPVSMVDKNVVIAFDVIDTGIGIAEEHLSVIFNQFEQLEINKYTRQYKGLGLGLAIVYDLVQLMGGSIQVESTINIGSSFKAIIPCGLVC